MVKAKAKQAPAKTPAPARSRKRTFGRMLLLGFVAVWMFALGVLVGRGTAPVHFELEQLQGQLAELKDIVTAEEGELFKVNLEKLKFFKNLRETGAEGAIPHKRALFKKPDNLKSIQGAAGEPQASPKVKAVVPTTGEPAGGLVIQVASSKDPDATRRLVARLQKDGYPAFSSKKEVPFKGVWYRIRVGPFTDRAAAERTVAWLKKKNFSAYIIKP